MLKQISSSLLVAALLTLKLFGFSGMDDLMFQKSVGKSGKKIVTKTKQIKLEQYPEAFNPSIIRYKENYLLIFRHLPDVEKDPYVSYIGVVLLDHSFEPISEPQLLDTRLGSSFPSQSEDARVFEYGGKLYLIYNDFTEGYFDYTQRRDMYVAELYEEDQQFLLAPPVKLFHEQKYHRQRIQKNWVPFKWNDSLLLSYSLDPHEVLFANLTDGNCCPLCSTSLCLKWNLGDLRPSTPPLLVDGEYLAFFHSTIHITSPVSEGYELYHMFTGAYTFSPEPPFEVKKMSPAPLVGDQFYTNSYRWKVVIYPGGFVVNDSHIYLAYGKNDSELWIATIDKKELLNSLVPVKVFSDSAYEPN